MTSPLRRGLAGLLVLVGVLALMLAVPALWARDVLLDTDRYVATVAPLGTDATVQDGVAQATAKAILDRVDLQRIAGSQLPEAARPLAAQAAEAARRYVEQVSSDFTHSSAFPDVWVRLNREAHTALVASLEGRPSTVVVDQQGRVLLDLGPVIEAVRDRLVGSGLTALRSLQAGHVRVEVARIQSFDRARTGVSWLRDAAAWAPWVAGASLVAAFLVSPYRRRTALSTGLGTAVAMALLWLLTVAARSAVVRTSPTGVIGAPAVTQVVDALLAPLHTAILVVGGAGLLLALLGALMPRRSVLSG